MKKIRLILCILYALSCIHQSCAQSITAQGGLIDLRHQDLSAQSVSLNGEWLFYWKQLLKPGDTSQTKPSLSIYPSLWRENTLNGVKLSSQGCATYKLTVLLPKHRPLLAIEMPDVYCSYSLYANGNLILQNGKPGKSAKESTPFWVYHVSHLPNNSDTLTLLLQVSNFWHAKGGLYKEMVLGDVGAIYLNYERNIAYGFVLAGCLIMGGLFFLGLYFFDRRQDKAILFFSLYCLFTCYRAVGSDLYVLHAIFPNIINWFVAIRLEYLSLVLSVAFFALYISNLYREDCNMFFMKLLVFLCLLFSITIVVTPPVFFTSLMPIFLTFMFVYIAYGCYVYVRAALKKRIGSAYGLISSTILLGLFLAENLSFFNLAVIPKPLMFVANIMFFFFQSLAFSQRFAHNFKIAALQAQQGLNAKAEFLSTMSHEIRTPLNAVIGMTHLLNNNPREDQRQNIDVLYFSANNLLSIVNNILDYTKIEEGKIAFENIPMDLSFIAKSIVAGLRTKAEEKGISLECCTDSRLDKKITGDPTRTSQVINNLLHNAVKFTEKGGVKLSILVDSFHENSVTITIKIEDTGIGIPQEKQAIIFDRFTQADSSTTRSYGGTGLGLTITKRILELQGVSLQLQSEPGKGSAFYFTQTFLLTNEEINIKKENIDLVQKTELLNGVSILLVEDNPMNILVAQTILERQGARIDVATNGQEAIDKLDVQRHKLILMDLNMPILDGYKATEELRKKGETIPIIALTASTPKEVESEAFASGLNDVVVKPFNPEDLYRTILHYVKAS
ncbi:MAG TPA: response regulator [Puia sp.]|nr:response regulator [Puia sp.]